MLGAYPDTRALPWPVSFPRPARRRVAVGATGRQAIRHGLRGAVQATCLGAALLAASGALGASRGPMVLSEPSQHTAIHLSVPSGAGVSAGFAHNVTTR